MATSFRFHKQQIRPNNLLFPGVILMTAVVCVSLLIVVLNSELTGSYPYLFLLPWILALAVILTVPTAVLYYKGSFTFYHPLVFATYSYFFPAFAIGGLAFVFGWSEPYFVSFIQDPGVTLPFTVELVMLGYASLALGQLIPLGAKIGTLIGDFLPNREYKPSSLLAPGVLLLSLGVINSLIAFFLGVFGYQKAAEINTYDGIIFLLTLFWMQASFLLWFLLFRRNRIDVVSVSIVICLLLIAGSRALFAGSRGSLLQLLVIIGFAFVLAGRRVTLKLGMLAGVMLVAALFVGITYGTTFRAVKGSEDRASAGDYTKSIFETFDELGRTDNAKSVEYAFRILSERLDAVSSLAVVVSNYEQLKPYEESYGLDNNIWNDTITFVVPRLIWADKPLGSDPRKYSELYFDYGDNSFTITPMGDLLRNFGVAGVPIGMFILGVFLRAIYRALIEGRQITTWRATLYFMLVTAVSYESFYGSILPFVFKVGVVTVLGIIIVNLLARRADMSSL